MKKTNFSSLLKIWSVVGLFSVGLILTSCDSGFDAMNVNETTATSLEPMMILNNQIRQIPNAGSNYHLNYSSAIIQQILTPFGQTFAGGNFNQDNQASWIISYWPNDYSRLTQAVHVLENTRGSDHNHNAHQKARILRAAMGLMITDSVGDAPFSEAGLGLEEGVLNPTYDSQEAIYTAALAELQAASAALDASKRIESTDILYAGDITKWKKFGYSLLLRHAMRLSEVAPATAEQYVSAAVAGGVFESNDDSAILLRDNNYSNAVSGNWHGNGRDAYYLTDVFVSHLQDNDDPRLSSFAVRYVGAESRGDQDDRAGRSTDSADQVGLPLGHDESTVDGQAQADGLASMHDYSQVDRDRIGSQTAPDFIITYAQVELLLAEAAERGWITGAGITHFENAIRAHMEQMEFIHSDMAITQADINDYVAAQVVSYTAGNAYEHIHNEYWIANFVITPREGFANWRRTGYPDLAPNPYDDQEIDGDFIRRALYPEREYSVNVDAVQAAVNAQGWSGNLFDERVWWDTNSFNP